MQTDCPTEVVKDRQMKGNRNGRMRQMIMSQLIGLDEKKQSYLAQGTQNLPHLKARKKTGKQTRTERYSEEEKKNREKTVKQTQHCEKAEDDHTRCKAEEVICSENLVHMHSS